MLGLRTDKGVEINELLKCLTEVQKKAFEKKLKSFFDDGLIIIEDKEIKIPQNKWLMSEYVSRELFILSE